MKALEQCSKPELIAIIVRLEKRIAELEVEVAKRFRLYGKAYFRFITTPGVSPTNNLAEQAIRFVVIDRHITQGTRSEAGRQWSERTWTVMATCALKLRDLTDPPPREHRGGGFALDHASNTGPLR